ncbi:MAG: hypothetical protein QOG66_1833 [Methylobacteriaceae bacterium]|nr:hypothetical protein [Methylobacteriaceae bacterium]
MHGYDVGILKYFDTPASWNRRMQRQLGAFLYDTFDYATNGFSDLENFLEQPEPPGPDADPIITKLLVPHSIGRGIFERLELVNATGTHLYDSPEGAAQDVINGYNYGRKTGRAWDIKP